MSRSEHESGAIEYVVEGYVLRWGAAGLEIQATEYRAGKLRLSWDDLRGLALRSGRSIDEHGAAQRG